MPLEQVETEAAEAAPVRATFVTQLIAPFAAPLAPERLPALLGRPDWFRTLVLFLGAVLAGGILTEIALIGIARAHLGQAGWEELLGHLMLPRGQAEVAAAIGRWCAFYGFVQVTAVAVTYYRCGRDEPVSQVINRALVCSYAGVVALCLFSVVGTHFVDELPSYMDWVSAAHVVPLGGYLYFGFVRRIADVIRPAGPLPRSGPTCEGCGYDLTARDFAQRCPECGRLVGDSTDPKRCRLGTNWEQHRRYAEAWALVMFSPTRFYRALRNNGDFRPGDSFARGIIVSLFVGACAAMAILLALQDALFGGPPGDVVLWLAIAAACWTLALCRIAHGLAASAAAVLLRSTCPVPDDRALALAASYEWAFAWLLAAFWGFSYGMIMAFQGPLTTMFGFVYGIPADALFVFGGTAALGVIGLYRYHLIARAIRWSNF